jgi:hypothetical protein
MNAASDLAHVMVSSGGGRQEFSLPWETTLGELERLAAEALGLQAATGIELWCVDGTCMSGKLGRTLGELRERLICPSRVFEFRPVPSK